MVIKRTLEDPNTAARGASSILLIAGSLIALFLIIGLVVDAGQIAVAYIRLEKAAQSAATEAAAGIPLPIPSAMDSVESAAALKVQKSSARFQDAAVRVYTCIGDGAGDHVDHSLCADPGLVQVRVVATSHIDFTFLQMLGIAGAEITARADGTTNGAY